MPIRIALAAFAVVAVGAACSPNEPVAAVTPSTTPSPTATVAPVTVKPATVAAAEPDAMLGGDNTGSANARAAEKAAGAASDAVAEAIRTYRADGNPANKLPLDESLQKKQVRALFDGLPNEPVEVQATATATERGPVIRVSADVLSFLFTTNEDGQPVLIAAGSEG